MERPEIRVPIELCSMDESQEEHLMGMRKALALLALATACAPVARKPVDGVDPKGHLPLMGLPPLSPAP
ncbi:MAG TPA: hypothetical protein VGE42_01670, partial [Candidatus Dormibacteraeota bacterium]